MSSHFDNQYLKRIIAGTFLFLAVIFGYFLGFKWLAEGRSGGYIWLAFGIYFFTSLFWMFKSMKHLYIATAIPFFVIVIGYLWMNFVMA